MVCQRVKLKRQQFLCTKGFHPNCLCVNFHFSHVFLNSFIDQCLQKYSILQEHQRIHTGEKQKQDK